MIERGRAIPNTHSVPIVTDKPQRAQDAPQYIDGRVSFTFLFLHFHDYFICDMKSLLLIYMA